MGKCKYDYSWSCKNMHASSQRPKMHKSARSRLRYGGTYGDMRTGPLEVLADTLKLFHPGEGEINDYANKAPMYLLLPLSKWGSKWGVFHWAIECV